MSVRDNSGFKRDAVTLPEPLYSSGDVTLQLTPADRHVEVTPPSGGAATTTVTLAHPAECAGAFVFIKCMSNDNCVVNAPNTSECSKTLTNTGDNILLFSDGVQWVVVRCLISTTISV